MNRYISQCLLSCYHHAKCQRSRRNCFRENAIRYDLCRNRVEASVSYWGERRTDRERERETETETERQSPKALRALEILLISMSTTQTVEEKRRRKKKHQKTTTFGLTFPTTLWPPEYQLVDVLSPVNASSRRLGHGN